MTRLWFTRRRYGWGWTPVTIEGWLVVFAFAVLVAAGAVVYATHIKSATDKSLATVLYLLWIGLLSGGLIAIGYATGEPPRWRWGK
jgi:hypothetical protein